MNNITQEMHNYTKSLEEALINVLDGEHAHDVVASTGCTLESADRICGLVGDIIKRGAGNFPNAVPAPKEKLKRSNAKKRFGQEYNYGDLNHEEAFIKLTDKSESKTVYSKLVVKDTGAAFYHDPWTRDLQGDLSSDTRVIYQGKNLDD
jgi:hypothetical protein